MLCPSSQVGLPYSPRLTFGKEKSLAATFILQVKTIVGSNHRPFVGSPCVCSGSPVHIRRHRADWHGQITAVSVNGCCSAGSSHSLPPGSRDAPLNLKHTECKRSRDRKRRDKGSHFSRKLGVVVVAEPDCYEPIATGAIGPKVSALH